MSGVEQKSIVVTGAGGGLGRAYALELARYGARVIVNDVDESGVGETLDLIRESRGEGVAAVGSVSDWGFAQSLPQTALSAFGRFDGLVNNAGIIHDRAPWEEDETSLRRLVEVNVLGAFYCGVSALKVLVPQGSGAIVNITSGSLLGLSGVSSYGATKAAVASMTTGWAIEVDGTGVRVNGVMPRGRTRMANARGAKDTSLGSARIAVPPSPQPEVIAPLVAYLMSDAATLNGRIIRHDGQRVTLVDPMSWGEGLPVDGRISVQQMADVVARLDVAGPAS